jgi:hypothetical protein
MSVAASPSGQKIDVATSVRAAYTVVIDNARLAVALAWLPFMILAGAQIVAWLLGNDRWFVQIPALLIDTAGWAVFIVRWHRFILLGETTAEALFPPGWGAYVWTGLKLWLLLSIGLLLFIGVALFLVIAMGAPTSLSGIIVIGSVIIFALVLALVWARVSLAFPAAAIERPISLMGNAWDLVAGNYWRLVACLIACCTPFGIFMYIVDQVGGALPSILRVVFLIGDLGLWFAGAAVVASLLSQIYRRLSPTRSAAEQSA